MFDIYIKDFNRNGVIVSTETLLQSIPAKSEDELKLINPIIKNEMGAAESFDFSIESGKKFYDAFKQMKTFIRVVYDGTTIFYGRVITIDNNGFRGTRRIRCEGPIAFLLDSPVEGVEEISRPKITANEYIKKLIKNHNSYINNEANKKFLIGEVPGNYSSDISSAQKIKNDSYKYGADSWTDTKSALEDLRSHYGGYFRTRLKSNIGSGVYLDWMDQYFNKNKIKQTVKVGKNILDINSVTELENIFTAIIPIGRKDVTSDTSSNTNTGSTKQTNLYLDNKVLKVPDIVSKYGDKLNFGYHTKEDYQNAVKKYGMIIKTVTFQEADTKDKLYEKACEWIKNNYQGEVLKFTIKAIDMHVIGENTSQIMVGDRVEIIYPVGDENGKFREVSTIQTCLNISFDLYHPENNSYTFGVPANILTKTYGVNKQAKSVASDSTIPKPKGSVSVPRQRSWEDVVAEWLMRHHEYFDQAHKPYTDDMGEQFQSGDYLYIPSRMLLAKAHAYRYIIDPANPDHEIPIGDADWYLTNPDAKTKWIYDGLCSYTGSIDANLIVNYHVCEWVLQEYGYDLRSQLSIKMPKTIVTPEGETLEYNEIIDPETGLPTYVLTSFSDGYHTEKYTADGYEIISVQDEDGGWHYYYKDNNGVIHETNIRDLTIQSQESENKIGWVVSEKQDGTYQLNPQTMPGVMTLAIENYRGGELVVARTAGELTYLGNNSTMYNCQVALQHIDNICGDFTYEKDDEDVDYIKVNSGGGMRVFHAKKDPITGEYIRDSQGVLKSAEFGIYDENTLTGGMITKHLADGSVVTKISGDIIDIEGSQVKVGNSFGNVTAWLEQHGYDLYDVEGLVAEKATFFEAAIGNLQTDKIDTTNINSKLARVSLLNVQSIATTAADGECHFDSYYGNHYYINMPGGAGSVTYKDLRDSIDYVYVTTSGATTTLHLHKITGGEVSQSDLPEGTKLTFKNYTGGWDAAVGKLSIPTSEVLNNNTIVVKYPPSTVDGAADSRSYYISNSSDNNKVDLVTQVGGSEVTVARYTHGKYNAGWSAAVGKLSIPTSSVTNNNAIVVKYPPSTVNGSADSRSYYIANTSGDNNKVDLITMVNNKEVTVARFTHGKYTAGANSSSITIDIPNGDIDVDYQEPSGTKLTILKNAILSAISSKMFLHFTVKAGSTSKKYYFDFR